MKPKEIRELSAEEIAQRIRDEERDLDALTFQHAVAPLEDAMVLRRKRREIARLKTILKQKQTAQATA
jgi:large subunit ribosomal protein L29